MGKADLPTDIKYVQIYYVKIYSDKKKNFASQIAWNRLSVIIEYQ